MGDELRARQAISDFMVEDRRISKRWDDILASSRKDAVTFEQLAGRIDANITADYQESFEQLSALNLDSGAPSARALETLRNYAALRSEASRALADGLRAKNPVKIREALETARRAPALANDVRAPASAASASSK